MSNFNHFDRLAPFYDRFFKLGDPSHIIGIVGLPIKGKILDAGGGTGRVSETMIGMADSIIIVDYSYGMLEQARQKNGLETICAPTEKLPFCSESFERVIIVDAFHHVANHEETLRELWRVLKPGGKIVIEEPDIRHIMVKLTAIVEKILLMRSHFINPMRIANMIQYPNANIEIHRKGYTTWIVIGKK